MNGLPIGQASSNVSVLADTPAILNSRAPRIVAYSAHMLKLVVFVALGVVVSACGGSKQPGPESPSKAGSGPMSPEECTAKGGTVKGDIGDGKVACSEGQTDLGRVNQGIEGAVCCAPAAK